MRHAPVPRTELNYSLWPGTIVDPQLQILVERSLLTHEDPRLRRCSVLSAPEIVHYNQVPALTLSTEPAQRALRKPATSTKPKRQKRLTK